MWISRRARRTAFVYPRATERSPRGAKSYAHPGPSRG